MSKIFGIIVCDSQAKWGGPEGIGKRLQETFAKDGEEWKVFIAEQEDLPSEEELMHFNGIYIAGSKHSINDETLTWIPKLLSLIQQCCLKKIKVFGTCFGHQAMAKALGGRVALNPNKKFICGNQEIALNMSENSEFTHHLQNINGGDSLHVLQSHGECVEELPKGAKIIASSVLCVHEIVLYNENMIGSQSHADFVNDDLASIILPIQKSRNAITNEEYEHAMSSLLKPNDGLQIIEAIHNFLSS